MSDYFGENLGVPYTVYNIKIKQSHAEKKI